jgi:transposase-like protein
MENRYYYRSRISEAKFRQIIKLFSEDLMATQIANLSGTSRVTINAILKGVRQRIAEYCEGQSPFQGTVEVDESYFGARRKKGKRGRGAYGKTIVFGIYKRNGKVYTEIVPDCTRKTLQSIIKGHVDSNSTIHSDKWRGYNGLVDLGYKKHYRIDHGNDEFAVGPNHINGIEGFWGLAKTRLVKFKGMHPKTFYLHLKECEFRYNYRYENVYNLLLKIIRNSPLNLS